jgi:hypothetical protein
VLQNSLFIERLTATVVFADHDGKFTAGVAEDRGAIHALDAID